MPLRRQVKEFDNATSLALSIEVASGWLSEARVTPMRQKTDTATKDLLSNFIIRRWDPRPLSNEPMSVFH